jgi:hypothetical protein
MQLPAPCRQRSSSSSGSRGSSCSCRATSDSSASSGPQQPSSSSSKASKSSWGSGWSGKRSGGAGSVFKKQSQQEKEPQADGPQQGAAVPEAEQLDPQLEASIRMNVERANQTLQDIIQVSTRLRRRWGRVCASVCSACSWPPCTL